MQLFDFLKYSDKTALVTDSGLAITYAEIENIAENFNLDGFIRPLVFILGDNTLGGILSYLSCLKKRAIPVLLEKTLPVQMLNELVIRYRPEFIFFPNDYPNPDIDRYVQKGDFYDYKKLRIESDIIANESNPNLALLLTTSGSTGSPKFVRISYQNLLANTVSIIDSLSISENETAITTLPMSYTYGLSVINTHLFAGAQLLITKRTLFEKEFWSFFKEGGATSFAGVPYMYEMLKRIQFFKMDLPSLKILTQAGGKLSQELAQEFADYAKNKNIKFVIMYGQTEATARMSYLPASFLQSKMTSIGIPIPGGNFTIINDNNESIEKPEQEGELLYKGQNVAMGYAESRADLSKGDEWQGILKTGDLAKRDEQGFYYITGRKKRFIKLFGKRISLDELEMLTNPISPDCVYAGVDNKLEVFLTEESKVDSIKTLLTKKVGIPQNAIQFHLIQRIPRNAAGKVNYQELRKS